MVRLILAATAGAIIAWSFYPQHWWAAILGIVLLLASLDKQDIKDRFKFVAIFAVTFFGFHLYWVSVLGIDAWLVLTLLCALPWLFLAISRVDSHSFWILLQPAAVVVLIEALRANWPWGGFPWGLIAYSQVDGPFVKLATIGGQALVSGVVVFLAAAVLMFIKSRKVIPLSIGLAIAFGSAVMVSFESNETIVLSAIQGNVPRVGNELSAQRAAVLNNHVSVTKQHLLEIKLGNSPAPALIVWPESGTDIDPLSPGIAADEISSLVSETDIPILIGATTRQGTDSLGPTNSGILWTKAGPGQIYSKNHLVPFGEYLPLRDFLGKWITRFDQIPNDFVAGDGPGVFDISGDLVGDVICFEVAYANHIYDTVTAGAQVFVVQTNNATYGNTTQPEQQFAITRFRAIETQRAFLVASTSGISGLIQNDGSVVVQTEQFVSDVVTGDANLVSKRTFSTQFPHWFLIASIVIVLVYSIRFLRRDQSFRWS